LRTRNAGKHFRFTPAIVPQLAGDIARDVRIAPRPVAKLVGTILRDVGIAMRALADQIGTLVTAVVGDLLHGPVGKRSSLAREILQMLLRKMSSCIGILTQASAQPADIAVVKTFEPSHRRAPKGLESNAFSQPRFPGLHLARDDPYRNHEL
jgi:hypothetical protein